MIRNRIVAGAFAFASGVAIAALPAFAAPTDYKFELVGKPQLSAHRDIVQVRLVHVADGKPVPEVLEVEMPFVRNRRLYYPAPAEPGKASPAPAAPSASPSGSPKSAELWTRG